MLRLLYISQLAEPEMHDLSIYVGQSDGDDDAAWFHSRLDELDIAERVDMTVVRVCMGESIPSPDAFDAAVIGGSYHMVGEQREWQLRILEWLSQARAASRPVLGICGGHQLMAHFHGASVGPTMEGTWTGTVAVTRTHDGDDHWLFEDVDESVGFHFGNSEHVSPPPADAQILAHSPTSPALAIDYGDGWVSVQFHPEMSVEGFVRYWRPIDPERADAYRHSPTSTLLLRNFIEQVTSGALAKA